MDRVWAQLYPEFTPSADVTLPNGGPEALAAYLNAEAAFRRGDYRTARDEYTRVIRADTGFAIGRLRLALVAAQVDPTEQGFGASLRGAVLHQRGLSSADSLLLDGFAALLSRGDGLTALARFKSATESAPAYPQAWYVLGEFYYHFAGLFDQSVGEARVAFNRVLDLDPRFSPAIGHLIALAHQAGDRAETERLIRQYLQIDSTSVVAEAVGIADTLILGSAADQLALLKHVCGHSFLALQYLAFQAAAFGTKAQREGPARAVLKCLPQRGAGDQERVRPLGAGARRRRAAAARGRAGATRRGRRAAPDQPRGRSAGARGPSPRRFERGAAAVGRRDAPLRRAQRAARARRIALAAAPRAGARRRGAWRQHRRRARVRVVRRANGLRGPGRPAASRGALPGDPGALRRPAYCAACDAPAPGTWNVPTTPA